MDFAILILLTVLGAVLGSFACCQAWRLKNLGKKKMPKRSVCMECGHKLAWWENIPVVSWVMLRGKCQQCGKKIGAAEILMEVMGAVSFVAIYLVLGPTPRLGVILALLVVMGVLVVYDGKWGELPTALLLLAVGLAGVSLIGVNINIVSAVVGVGLTAGLYLVLNVVSRGRLVGNGDWLLALAVSLALANWWLAVITLALSNLMAVVYAIFAQKKRIYFGPFLVAAFVIVFSLQEVLCSLCLI